MADSSRYSAICGIDWLCAVPKKEGEWMQSATHRLWIDTEHAEKEPPSRIMAGAEYRRHASPKKQVPTPKEGLTVGPLH